MQYRQYAGAPLFGTSSISLKMLIVPTLALALGACTMSETGQRVGSGAAIGAVGGAILGGNTEGAVIGAAVGAAGGYMVDQHKKREDTDSENAQLKAENERLRQQNGQ
jgi:osmotically inducible lipoprotein OsmB